MTFFSDKDSYSRYKDEKHWENSLIEQIRQLYSDPSIDYDSYRGIRISY
jgi:hypothetical protein